MNRKFLKHGMLATLLIPLGACGYGDRIAGLEQRAYKADQAIAAFSTKVTRSSEEVRHLTRLVTARSRLSVTVTESDWRTVYSNGTGQSQFVRVTHRTGSGGTLELRRAPFVVAPDASPLPGFPDLTREKPSAAWDLSPVGSNRAQRLPCGWTIEARASGGIHKLDVLVQEDPQPVTVC